MRLTPDQQERVLAIFRDTPWGDVAGALGVIDRGLEIAMRATSTDFFYWEQHADSAGIPDEFNVPDLSALSDTWRYALVASAHSFDRDVLRRRN